MDNELADELRDALSAAYEAGATDVHNWAAAGNIESVADFAEAASDYAAAAMDPFSSAAKGVSADFLAALRAAAGHTTTTTAAVREALEKIAYLRPAGDVSKCKEPRVLVERMERIALAALQLPADQQGEGGA